MLKGTPVLIFERTNERGENLKSYNFLMGKVVSSRLSEDLSHHGSPWHLVLYTVMDEKFREYTATDGEFCLTDYYILTVDKYIEYLKDYLSKNNQKLLNIYEKNSKLLKVISSLVEIKNEKNYSKKLINGR